MREDYYELLDVDAQADAAAIKRAYYRQARRFHPDRNPDNAAAEERFKLVAEAYRVLGDEEQRFQYDGWLERHKKLSAAPELESMPHRVRVSTRHARERREERRKRRERPAHARPFLLSRRRPPSLGTMVAVYALAACLIVPTIVNGLSSVADRSAAAAEHDGPEPTAEQVQERLARMNAELLERARAGEVQAQVRYGLLLYRGAGIVQNRAEARAWWQKAAAQGSSTAQYYLNHCPEDQGPANEDGGK